MARTLGRVETYSGRSQGLEAETVRLREELEKEKAEKAAALERIRVLEEKLRLESNIAQKAEAAQIAKKVEAVGIQISNEYKDPESMREVIANHIYEAIMKAVEKRTVMMDGQIKRLKDHLECVMKELAITRSAIGLGYDILARDRCESSKRMTGLGVRIDDLNTEMPQKVATMLSEALARHGRKVDPSILLPAVTRYFSLRQSGSLNFMGAI